MENRAEMIFGLEVGPYVFEKTQYSESGKLNPITISITPAPCLACLVSGKGCSYSGIHFLSPIVDKVRIYEPG